MKKRKNKLPKGIKSFKFKIYWIYAIIFLFFIGIQIVGNEPTKPTNWQEFNRDMLQPRKVEKVTVVNEEKVYVYIKKEYLNEEQFNDISKKTFGNTPNYGPHYFFEIGSYDTFHKEMLQNTFLA